MKTCQWCSNSFTTKISYQIYCSAGCRDAATKEKIAERYIASRSKRRYGKQRKCKSCEKVLSAYNDGTVCLDCDILPSEVTKTLKELKGFADGKFDKDK